MNPMKHSKSKNQEPCGSAISGSSDKIKLGVPSIWTMDNCELCSKEVFSGTPDSLSRDNGLLENSSQKAEVTSRFLQSFDRVRRMVNEADDVYGILKSRMMETTDCHISNVPSLCQECADKVQTVDTLANLLKVQVLGIRKLLANKKTMKITDMIQPDKTSNQISSQTERIKYDSEFMRILGNKETEYFNVLEHGFPDLVPCLKINGLNGVADAEVVLKDLKGVEALDENPKSSSFSITEDDFKPKTIEKGSKNTETMTPVVTSNVLSMNTSKAPITPVNKLIVRETVTDPLNIANSNPNECPIEKLRTLLYDPKLSPENFDKVIAFHVTFIPSSYFHAALHMLLERAIEKPEILKRMTYLLEVVMEIWNASSNYQALHRRWINDYCKSEIQTKLSDRPQVIQVKEQLSTEYDENVCDNLRLDLERLKYTFKRRLLNVMKLMGKLYKNKLISSELIFETIDQFMKASQEENLECACLLITIVGEYLITEGPRKANRLEKQLLHLVERAERKKISVKVEELIYNLLKLYNNKWKWEGLVETEYPTAMIFQNFAASAAKNFEATISSTSFNFYFPGTEVGIFVENLCKLAAKSPKFWKVEDAGKLIRLLIANRNISKLEALFEISSALQNIAKDVKDISKTANNLAQFLYETFSEEGSIDWLLITGKQTRQENPLFWEQMVTEIFERLVSRSKTSVHSLRMIINRPAQNTELQELFVMWEEKRFMHRSKKLEDLMRQKIFKGASLSQLQSVLQRCSQGLNQKFTARILTEAICKLSWNISTKNFIDQKLKLLLPLLKLPNPNIFPIVWIQVEAFGRRNNIEKKTLEQVLNAMYFLKLTTN